MRTKFLANVRDKFSAVFLLKMSTGNIDINHTNSYFNCYHMWNPLTLARDLAGFSLRFTL
jgi:hypothetical protein